MKWLRNDVDIMTSVAVYAVAEDVNVVLDNASAPSTSGDSTNDH
jgi:hypothetical protein